MLPLFKSCINPCEVSFFNFFPYRSEVSLSLTDDMRRTHWFGMDIDGCRLICSIGFSNCCPDWHWFGMNIGGCGLIWFRLIAMDIWFWLIFIGISWPIPVKNITMLSKKCYVINFQLRIGITFRNLGVACELTILIHMVLSILRN